MGQHDGGMRIVTQDELGGPHVLRLAEVNRPEPSPGEVLIKLGAAGVNPVDAVVRSGNYRPRDGSTIDVDLRAERFAIPPFTTGWDIAGRVESCGPGVSAFRHGDQVMGLLSFPELASTHADFVIASTNEIVLKPADMPTTEAGGLPMAGLTAWQALIGIAKVADQERVLVHAAAGGVGHLAVQIAKAVGADVVATTSAGNHHFVRGLGADEVIDYRVEDFVTATSPVDVVLDLVGGEYAERSLKVLKPGGRLVSAVTVYPGTTQERAERAGRCFREVHVRPSTQDLATLVRLFQDGRLQVQVSHVLALTEAAEAHRLVEGGHVAGKVVLIP